MLEQLKKEVYEANTRKIRRAGPRRALELRE